MSIRACASHLGCPSEQLIAALLPDVTAPRSTPRPVSLPTLPVPTLPVLGLPSIDDPDTANDMIAIASVPGGRHRVDDRGALALPAAARRMCGITIGRPVILLAAV